MNKTPPVSYLDIYKPEEVFSLVESAGQQRLRAPNTKTVVLALMAGGFVAIGCTMQLIVSSKMEGGLGLVLPAFFYGLGYCFALLSGGEVFTSNNLQVVACLRDRTLWRTLLRKWGLVLFGNAFGAYSMVLIFYFSGHVDSTREVTASLAATKFSKTAFQLFFSSILGSLLVCAGVWLAYSGRTLIDKASILIVSIGLLPIAGLDHIVTHLYYYGKALVLAPQMFALQPVLLQMVIVSAGNLVGGAVMIAALYYFLYGRSAQPRE